MLDRLKDYQEQYGDLYNLEATPAESTTYRLAKHDVAQFPDIITAAEAGGTPYYTNSSHLPVGYTEDIFAALDVQDELQTMSPIKLNTVLIGGFNDDEIFKLSELTRSCQLDLRFIELMPIGDAYRFPKEAYLPCSAVLEKVPELIPVAGDSGVAQMYRLPDSKGRVGLISPISDAFCSRCNRLRLTSDGCLKPCLHSAEEIHLRGLHGAELQWALKLAIAHKPENHGELSDTSRSLSRRNMNRIGG